MQRKAAKEIQRQQTSAEAAAHNAAAEQLEANKRAHEAAMAAHLGQHPMAASLTTRTTIEDAIAAGQATSATTMREEGSPTMRD